MVQYLECYCRPAEGTGFHSTTIFHSFLYHSDSSEIQSLFFSLRMLELEDDNMFCWSPLLSVEDLTWQRWASSTDQILRLGDEIQLPTLTLSSVGKMPCSINISSLFHRQNNTSKRKVPREIKSGEVYKYHGYINISQNMKP